MAVIAMIVIGESLPSGKYLWASLGAGAIGAVGLLALYRALAVGIMSIAAPISALAAVIPFLWGIAGGERPAMVQLIGGLLALGGALLAAREPSHAQVSRERFRESVTLALFAAVALGFGLVLLGIAAPGRAMPVMVADRIATTALILPLALIRKQGPPANIKILLPMIAVGALDTAANALYIFAFNEGGLMSMVGLLASLYPITTVILARGFLGERLERHQAAGVALALLGIAVISV